MPRFTDERIHQSGRTPGTKKRDPEDITDELLERLRLTKLEFTVVPLTDKLVKRVAAVILAVQWNQGVEQAWMTLSSSGGSCLLLDDFFARLIDQMNIRYRGREVAIERAMPQPRAGAQDTIKEAQVNRRIVLRVAVLAD